MRSGNPKPFARPADLRRWLEKNHRKATELIVLLYRKGSGRASIGWPELVDQLLCFGWIDGVRKSIGVDAYTIRVTPRRKGSRWSAVNVRRARQLIEMGLMEAAGRAAFDARDEGKSDAYSHESPASLAPDYEAEFRSHTVAWKYFASQAPYYRRVAAHWVMTAKREETRRRRLETLIGDSANGIRIGPMRRSSGPRGESG